MPSGETIRISKVFRLFAGNNRGNSFTFPELPDNLQFYNQDGIEGKIEKHFDRCCETGYNEKKIERHTIQLIEARNEIGKRIEKNIKHVVVLHRFETYTALLYFPDFYTNGIILKQFNLERKCVSVTRWLLTDEEVETMILPRII